MRPRAEDQVQHGGSAVRHLERYLLLDVREDSIPCAGEGCPPPLLFVLGRQTIVRVVLIKGARGRRTVVKDGLGPRKTS
eukprot:scaffold1311_cov256-Pinguiococcus_pyrenoidosus.AAC.48